MRGVGIIIIGLYGPIYTRIVLGSDKYVVRSCESVRGKFQGA